MLDIIRKARVALIPLWTRYIDCNSPGIPSAAVPVKCLRAESEGCQETRHHARELISWSRAAERGDGAGLLQEGAGESPGGFCHVRRLFCTFSTYFLACRRRGAGPGGNGSL